MLQKNNDSKVNSEMSGCLPVSKGRYSVSVSTDQMASNQSFGGRAGPWRPGSGTAVTVVLEVGIIALVDPEDRASSQRIILKT